MSKMALKKSNDVIEAEISKEFAGIDTSDFPDFYKYKNPLERGLWVLWVAKKESGIKKLTAEQIASVIRDVKEISIDAISITNAFNRAGDKIHAYREARATYFEIMKPGKNYLLSQVKEGSVELFILNLVNVFQVRGSCPRI